jgi:hypothetical protein
LGVGGVERLRWGGEKETDLMLDTGRATYVVIVPMTNQLTASQLASIVPFRSDCSLFDPSSVRQTTFIEPDGEILFVHPVRDQIVYRIGIQV